MSSFFIRALVLLFAISLLSGSHTWDLEAVSSDYQQQQKRDFVRIKQGDTTLVSIIIERAFAQQDTYWLEQAAKFGDASAWYKLALLAKEEKQRFKWLKLAAEANNAAAQFDLSLLPSYRAQRQTLLQRSAEYGYPAAQHALANWYLLNQQEEDARVWLEKSALNYADDAFSLANILWREGEFQTAIEWFQHAANKEHASAKQFLAVAIEHTPLSLADLDKYNLQFNRAAGTNDRECGKNILPISVTLSNHVQAIDIVKQLKADQRFVDIPICISEPLWLQNTAGLCEQQIIAGRNRPVCDVTQLGSLIQRNNVSHIVLLLPDGRAYVNAGIMYLNVLANYALFVHELAHFSGFADEYPISDELAEVHCAAKTAPNLLFDGELAYEPMDRLFNWQSLVENEQPETQLSLHPARTCNNSGGKAYKMTSQRTFMEFHDTENIPLQYQWLWREQVLNKTHWYPVAINLARHYDNQNETALASNWRQFAEQQKQTLANKSSIPIERLNKDLNNTSLHLITPQ